jgi:hypothetical protein
LCWLETLTAFNQHANFPHDILQGAGRYQEQTRPLLSQYILPNHIKFMSLLVPIDGAQRPKADAALVPLLI